MTTKKYLLKHNDADFYVHKQFSRVFKNGLVEWIESPINEIHVEGLSHDECDPGDLHTYDLNDVCVVLYTQMRYIDVEKNCAWNLRMIGNKKQIKVLNREIRLQGFTLEEIV